MPHWGEEPTDLYLCRCIPDSATCLWRCSSSQAERRRRRRSPPGTRRRTSGGGWTLQPRRWRHTWRGRGRGRGKKKRRGGGRGSHFLTLRRRLRSRSRSRHSSSDRQSWRSSQCRTSSRDSRNNSSSNNNNTSTQMTISTLATAPEGIPSWTSSSRSCRCSSPQTFPYSETNISVFVKKINDFSTLGNPTSTPWGPGGGSGRGSGGSSSSSIPIQRPASKSVRYGHRLINNVHRSLTLFLFYPQNQNLGSTETESSSSSREWGEMHKKILFDIFHVAFVSN